MHEHRGLQEWVTYNEYMCSLVRRVGAPTAIELATIWLDTMGRFFKDHVDDYVPEKPDPSQVSQ